MNRVTAFMTSLAVVAVFLFSVSIHAAIEEEGERLLQLRCMKCHDLKRITDSDKDRDGWENTVRRMMSIGARVSPAEKETLINYLAREDKARP